MKTMEEGLLLMAYLVCFVRAPRTTYLPRRGTALSELGPPRPIINQKDGSTNHFAGEIFSVEVPFSKKTLACVKLT